MDRSDYIGGSDWYELRQGCWRRLWLDKRCGAGHEQTGAMVRGQKLEQPIAEEYAARTGKQVRKEPRLIRRGQYGLERYFCAHVDRWAIDHARPHGQRMGVLEIKTVNPWRWRTIQKEGIPEQWIDQIQWYLWVCERPWVDLVVCEPLDWQIEIRSYLPDAVRIHQLIERAQRFAQILANGDPPEPLPPTDQRCRRCRWWSECHPSELGEPEPLDGEIERDDALEDLARADMEARKILREAQDHAERVRAQLVEALAGRRRVAAGLYQIESRTIRRRSYTVPESTYEQISVKEMK